MVIKTLWPIYLHYFHYVQPNTWKCETMLKYAIHIGCWWWLISSSCLFLHHIAKKYTVLVSSSDSNCWREVWARPSTLCPTSREVAFKRHCFCAIIFINALTILDGLPDSGNLQFVMTVKSKQGLQKNRIALWDVCMTESFLSPVCYNEFVMLCS